MGADVRRNEPNDFYHGDEALRREGRDTRAKEIALAMMDSCTRDASKVIRTGGQQVDLKFTLLSMEFSDAPVRGTEEFRTMQALADLTPRELQALAEGNEISSTDGMTGDVEFLAKILVSFKTLLDAKEGDASVRETLEASTRGARAAIDEALANYENAGDLGVSTGDVASVPEEGATG